MTALTFVRLPLIALFFTAAILHIRHGRPWLFAMSFGALVIAALSDLCDGYFARRLRVVTTLGAHADPLMDKFTYIGTLPVLTFAAAWNRHWLHAVILLVMTTLFLGRDQWVTFLRSIAAGADADVHANWAGKLRTCINMPLICAIFWEEQGPRSLVPLHVLMTFEAVALAVNALSAYVYTKRFRAHLRRYFEPVTEDASVKPRS